MILDDLWHGWDGVYASILALIDLLAAFNTMTTMVSIWIDSEDWGLITQCCAGSHFSRFGSPGSVSIGGDWGGKFPPLALTL